MRDPNGVGQDCVYDALGRDIQCTDTAGSVTQSVYDRSGNKIASTDAKSNTTTYTFDARGRQIKQTDRLSGDTLFAYTATGQLLSLTDAENQVTSYTYDAAGNKLTETYPDHVPSSTIGQPGYGIVSFTPDATGRTIQRTDQQGDTCDFTYDLAGRLSSKAYTGHASGPLSGQSGTDSFTYDDVSRMLTAVSGRYSNTVTYSYDDAGRQASESIQIGGQTYTTLTEYDAAGQVSKLTYPDGKEVERSYSTRGQLTGIDFDGTTIDTRTYDDGGRMLTSSYNNGVSETRAYNNDNTLTSINFSGASVGDLSYNWDVNKNKTSEGITGTMSGYGFDVGTSGYDDEDRLVSWQRDDNNLDQAWNLSLVGDWNSITENASVQSRTHGPTHEILTAAGQSVTHDAKGNQTLLPTSLSSLATSLSFKWDFENKLISADTDNDTVADVSYQWDALGRRVGRDDGTSATVFVQSGQQTIADYTSGTAAASPTYTYAYASYIDEPVMRSGSGGLRYYHRNQQYSVIALTNGGGSISERYAYDAYGTPTIADASGTTLTASADNNRYTYTGREYDEALGLYHYRARMYDSIAGRFCSRDPIGFGDGPSLYNVYFAVNGMDPSGLCKVICPQRQTQLVRTRPHFHGNPHCGGNTSDSIDVQITDSEVGLAPCGSFYWKNKWKLKTAAGASGGYILQHVKTTIRIFKCDGTTVMDQTTKLWEAFEFTAGADRPKQEADGIGHHDKFGVEFDPDLTETVCTKGEIIVDGNYGYVDGPIPSDKLPEGGAEDARDLPSTTSDPGISTGHKRDHYIHVKWNCCPK